MTPPARLRILFGERRIRARVRALARAIARAPLKPDLAAPILAGGYVMAADLLRGLAREGLMLPTEFIWLRSYGHRRTGDEVMVLAGPSDLVRGRTVLLIDGVLDRGRTLAHAKQLLFERGAGAVISAVTVDKGRADALAAADYAAFRNVDAFLVGYGMDDANTGRGLPYIAAIE